MRRIRYRPPSDGGVLKSPLLHSYNTLLCILILMFSIMDLYYIHCYKYNIILLYAWYCTGGAPYAEPIIDSTVPSPTLSLGLTL